MRPTAIALLVVFVVCSALVKREVMRANAPRSKSSMGRVAAELVLNDRQGTAHDLHTIARDKKLVVVTFWATWCVPCRIELPTLESVYQKRRGDGLEILAVNEDREPEELTKYLTERPLSFPVLVDSDGEVAKRYGVKSFPLTLMVDRKGKIVFAEEGLQRNLSDEVERQLERAKARHDG